MVELALMKSTISQLCAVKSAEIKFAAFKTTFQELVILESDTQKMAVEEVQRFRFFWPFKILEPYPGETSLMLKQLFKLDSGSD